MSYGTHLRRVVEHVASLPDSERRAVTVRRRDPAIDCAFCHGDGEACNPGNADPSVKVLEWLAPVICPRCGGTGKDPNHG